MDRREYGHDGICTERHKKFTRWTERQMDRQADRKADRKLSRGVERHIGSEEAGKQD